MKKILSLVLVIALVLGSFSFAFAATPADVVDTDYEEAVEVLMALGVVNGYPDGTYKPERVVTRAEMAKLLVEALGYGQLAGGTAPYSDTAGHWAAGSIGLASGIGLVQGYPDGTFKPDATVTFDEAVTMILRALGYTDESLRGAWPTNYKIKAIDLGLYDDTSAQTGGADRGNVAIMLFNALGLQLVEVKEGVATPVVTGALLLIDKVGKKVPEVSISYDDIYDEDDALDTAIDLAPYLYHTITYYENKDGEVAYVSKVHTSEYVGKVKPYDSGKLVIEDANEKTKSFAVTSGTSVFLNGDLAVSTTAGALNVDGSAYARVIYKDSTVHGVVVEQFEIVRIGTEYAVRRPAFLNGSGTGSIALPAVEDDDDNVVLDASALTIVGDATALTAIEEDDLVYVYASETVGDVSGHPAVLKLLVVRDVVEGRLTQTNTAGTEGVFGGVTYKASAFKVYSGTLNALKLGDVFELTLDKDGKIYDLTDADTDEVVEGYAVYVDKTGGTIKTDEWSGDRVVDKAPRVKLFTAGGNVVIYNINTEDLADATSDFTATSSVAIGHLTISYTHESSVIDVTTNSALGFKSLVEYEMNSDGEVETVRTMTNTYSNYDKDDMLVGTLDVTSSTVVFNVVSDKEGDWTVISASDLVDNVAGNYVGTDTGFRVAAMTVKTGLDEAATYAAVTKVVNFYDGKDAVQQITAFVDGVATTYLTKAGTGDYATYVDKLVKLEFDGARVKSAAPIALSNANAVKVRTIDSVRIREDVTNLLYALDSDVVVYIVEKDDDFLVGQLSDILVGDYVHLVTEDGMEKGTGDVIIIILDLDQDQYLP